MIKAKVNDKSKYERREENYISLLLEYKNLTTDEIEQVKKFIVDLKKQRNSEIV